MNDDDFLLVPVERKPRDVAPEPYAQPRPKVSKPRLAPEENARAKVIARAYCDIQPLSNAKTVQTIVAKAIAAKRWKDGEILDALVRLAGDDRRVTPETLRVELTYRLSERRAQRERGELKEESVVYVIGADESRLVKIGTSTDRMTRLHSIQLMCPVELRILYHVPGGYELENALHTAFRAYRKHGEWFDFGDRDPVEMVVRRLPLVLRKLGVDPIVMFLSEQEAHTAQPSTLKGA